MHINRRNLVSAASGLLLTSTLLAQPSANRTSSDSNSDEAITLSPFTVSADKSNDYVASESTTGTRIVSKIRDLPFQVNVITSEFMLDFGAYDMSQQLGWVSNVSPSDSQGSLVLRGFSTTPFIDGFRRLSSLDVVDTERVEIIKGPAASIYGQTLPGGVVNYVSRRPQTRERNTIDMTFGNEGFARGSAMSTGPVGKSKKLFYLANVSLSNRNFEQEFASQRTKFGSFGLMYKPDADTTVWAKVSFQDNHNRDRQSIPWVKSSTSGFLTNNNGKLGINADGTPLKYTYPTYSYNATTNTWSSKLTTANVPLSQVLVRYANLPGDIAAYNKYIADPSSWSTPLVLNSQLQTTNSWDRLATEWPTLHTDGPLSFSDANLWSANLSGEHRWSDLLSTKFTVDAYRRGTDRQSVSGNQMYYTDPTWPDGEVGGATPTWRTGYTKGYSSQLDNLISFKTGPVSHKFLVTFDFADRDDRNKTITSDTSKSDRFVITDPSGLVYPLNLPLGPRSTGILRWNTSAQSATQPIPQYSYYAGTQELNWPITDASYFYPTYGAYPDLYTRTTTNTLGQSQDYGLFMSERAIFFKGRVTALVGGRYDYLRNGYNNYLATDASSRHSEWSDHAATYQLGLTGYLTKNIIAFANKSSAYNPNMQVVNVRTAVPVLDSSGNPVLDQDGNAVNNIAYSTKVLPNETGRGYEYGLRFVALNERLNIGVTRFVIDRANKVDSYTNEYGISEYVGSGAQRSKGYEFDFNWSLTDSLQVGGAYGYNNAKYTASTLAYLVGTGTPQNAKDNIAFWARYQFRRGALKGLSFNVGGRYYSKSLVSVGSGGLISLNPFAGSWKPLIYNTPLSSGALPFPDLPAGVVLLSRNAPTAGADPGGAINPSTGAALVNGQVNKGYTPGVNIPSDWVLYSPGTTMDAGKQYYVLDGDGRTARSYVRTTNIDDNRANVYNQPYTIYSLGVGYGFRAWKIDHRIRFNVENALNKFYTYGGGVLGFRREYKVTYSLSF